LLVGRIVRFDVRSGGSGNIGATNVARTLGFRLGLVTLAGDLLKGALPVLALGAAGAGTGLAVLAGLAAFYGHIFSLFARFRGGKGVATAAGVFLAASPLAGLIAVLVFAGAFAKWRIVSVASLAAGSALPMGLVLLGDIGPRFWAALAVALTLFATHRDNLRRLASGTEPPLRIKRS
jgi:glycerol-3-phosphate acyltransferase PlsY